MSAGELLLYTTPDGQATIQLRALDGTVWLSQAELAELFQTSVPNINIHIRNILAEGELIAEATIKEHLIVAQEGGREVRRQVKLCKLDMVLAIGYRVRSHRGTQFRQWATTHLREYLVKGFVMDDERLKDPGGWDYFDELLARIRDIRASEKRFYDKVRDIYATAIDYDAGTDAAQAFFKKVQNKMLYAVTGQTAAELVSQRADAAAPNMGLTAWKGERVRKQDVTIAKNYLGKDELAELNRIVTMYLDFAEDQAQRRKAMTMADWASRLDAFLQFNEREVLDNAGQVSHAVAERLAHERYEVFDAARRGEDAVSGVADIQTLEEIAKRPRGSSRG
ncbi:virulence RhuM family protein [Roseateles sp. BYS78W]|uniref:Virulence RhuM family protein n=1 Tax=Pelomonas candidula TaxID=3299025 RepID=A0ABW7H5V6_9BURK